MIQRLAFSLMVFTFAPSVRAPADLDLKEAVMIGGIKQWISLKGTDGANPVLLFLHGGPGGSAVGKSDQYTGELQKHFLVVQWDQRESGTTAKLNPSPVPLTLALFENDTFEMINYLRNRFKKDKIYLVGHSWGGYLGLAMAAKHPEVIEAYIAINPMVYQVESERLSLDFMKSKARADNNRKAQEELEKIKIPFENGLQLYYHRKWVAAAMGSREESQAYVEQWSKKWLALFNEASRVNFFTAAPELQCAVYFCLGSRDYLTDFKLTAEYFRVVKAEKKKLFWFTESGHAIPQTEPTKLQKIIIGLLLPKPLN